MEFNKEFFYFSFQVGVLISLSVSLYFINTSHKKPNILGSVIIAILILLSSIIGIISNDDLEFERDKFILPVHEYGHSEGVAVIGGHTYYGNNTYNGTYIYADFGTGKIWGLSQTGDTYKNELIIDTDLFISSLSLNGDNEIIINSFDRMEDISDLLPNGTVPTHDGRLYHLDLSGSQPDIILAYPHLSFERPLDTIYLYDKVRVATQAGVIYEFDDNGNVTDMREYLNITSKVRRNSNEEGLLGFALDPNYEENGDFFVYYSASNPLRTVLSRFTSIEGQVEIGSEIIIMEAEQPSGVHNGGQILFGPDGYLYLGLGDGGVRDNGQDLGNLLGSIIRISVSNLTDNYGYEVPPDNPFQGNNEGFREEIFAYGLRNPFRFSFDQQTGQLWVGDVGERYREEINLVIKGGNYGWNIMEGSSCKPKASEGVLQDVIEDCYTPASTWQLASSIVAGSILGLIISFRLYTFHRGKK